MRLVFALSLGMALGSCSRPEEPQSSPAAQMPTSSNTPVAERQDEAGSSDANPRCVLETSTTPEPAAQPASVCPTDPDTPPALSRGTVTFRDAPEQPTISVEIASSEDDRSRGLMYRTKLPDDDGMLFSWTDERVRSFWMHNTCIPLDMLFIAADGLIVGILEQVPTLNDLPRSVPCPAAHVLEVNAGWSRRHGIKAGQRITIKTGSPGAP